MYRLFGSSKFYLWAALILAVLAIVVFVKIKEDQKNGGLDSFRAHPYLTTKLKVKSAAAVSGGITPATIKAVYNLPTGNVGSGTIAIIDAYDNPNAEADLATFDAQYNLPACTSQNGCFTKVKMKTKLSGSTGWGLEENLDVQWAHAIAPNAKILLVEAASDSGPNLMAAVSYAVSQPNVSSVSMSWGGSEFSDESKYDSSFSSSNIQFFAAAGDNGHAASWPAASANVIAVGGTTLNLDGVGKMISEVAWSGSGGGLSKYIDEPTWQQSYGIHNDSGGKRAMPDVSFNADPNSGYPVYDSYGHTKADSWLIVGGTSAGTPQWAAIQAISKSTKASKMYSDAKSRNADQYFHDILSGSNGTCKLLCAANTGYDFVTGLGSPLTQKY